MFARAGPEPLDEELRPTEVADARSLFCRSYDGCLEEAVRNRWVSWTCGGCSRFVPPRQRVTAPAPSSVAARIASPLEPAQAFRG